MLDSVLIFIIVLASSKPSAVYNYLGFVLTTPPLSIISGILIMSSKWNLVTKDLRFGLISNFILCLRRMMLHAYLLDGNICVYWHGIICIYNLLLGDTNSVETKYLRLKCHLSPEIGKAIALSEKPGSIQMGSNHTRRLSTQFEYIIFGFCVLPKNRYK